MISLLRSIKRAFATALLLAGRYGNPGSGLASVNMETPQCDESPPKLMLVLQAKLSLSSYLTDNAESYYLNISATHVP